MTPFRGQTLNAGHFLQVATMAIGHRVMSHLLFGSVAEHVHAVSRGLASFAPGHSSGWLRAYGGGESSFTPKRSAACQTQRGLSRNARAMATMSALPEAMISSACSGSAIIPTARTLMLTDFFTCAA